MKNIFYAVCILFFSFSSSAEPIFKIEVGDDYSNYSASDLKKRVWELERAVSQLQQRIFQLEFAKATPPTQPVAPPADVWVCRISKFGKSYTGTGSSKAVAKLKVTEACISGNDGNDFHCKNPECEQ
ncbi:MAG TPA: hypothetical protein PLJ21_05080 [Pseudobdellovibrionaceae bacterium]|nr:hypothetical protein [Pseudobdellovibrionaceae bacterium]